MKVVVTGSQGFIGNLVMAQLREQGHVPLECDVDDDVMSHEWRTEADAAIHLAAEKYAIRGEERPVGTAALNIIGTERVTERVPRVVFASTCKAAAPITCYGASKLIAERIVLNAGGTVVRLVNVWGSSGSVSQIWENVPRDQPLPVTDSKRMFMRPEEAAWILVHALGLPSGRYGPTRYESWDMHHLAAFMWPRRETVTIPLRRGDRPVERLTSDYEIVEHFEDGVVRIYDPWEETSKETCLSIPG